MKSVSEEGTMTARSAAPGGGAPVPAGEYGCGDSRRAGPHEGGDHVRRFAAGGEPEGQIARSAVALDLAGEDFGIIIIVGDGCHGARIADQGDGRERAAFPDEASDQLAREVSGQRGASAISEDENLPAS